MRYQTDGENGFDTLRARYDAAFAMWCRARQQLERGQAEGSAEQQVRELRLRVDQCHRAYLKARDELATCLLDRMGRRIAGFYWGFECYAEQRERIAC